MKIVIDIPEEYYNFIKNHQYMDRYYSIPEASKIFCAIKNGTSLPKNHGNIYDENDLRKLGAVYFESNIRAVNDKGPWRYKDISLVISAKPIIPAESEEEE